jgi:hypothetical protein
MGAGVHLEQELVVGDSRVMMVPLLLKDSLVCWGLTNPCPCPCRSSRGTSRAKV